MQSTGAILPIETLYNGVVFRSRLEARWAVFFDHLDIPWAYEYEGFQLRQRWYLPDLYLPTLDLWIEIKPTKPTADEMECCRQLAEQVTGKVRLMYGPVGWWQWSLPIDPRRVGGVGLICDQGPDGTYASVDDAAYMPCICATCSRFGIEFGGRIARVCGCSDNDRLSGTHDRRLTHAASTALAYQFEHSSRRR